MTIHITYFVHGTTTDNEQDIATGWNHGILSEKGIKQSEELGKLMKNKKFDAVFCSDLKRAVDSAKICFGNKFQIIQDKRLREANYGEFTGKSCMLFKKDLTIFISKKFPHGESYKDVEQRIKNFLEFLKQQYDGKRIAIVAHQAPQLALEVLCNKKTWKQAIAEDWRLKKEWKPGWEYRID
ncbi:histidine phosphatase family protein [Candidatus Woesearchaeota archaeon]|nr:histidine phosphatase family protein [Candidatus Woesearchaeota archaeon]